jgi:hypothetical protein
MYRLPKRELMPRDISRLELIARLGREWKRLREKYPDAYDASWGGNSDGWRVLAVGLAIAALAEEEYGVKHWSELSHPMKRRNHATKTT